MIQIRILSIFSTTLHNPSTTHILHAQPEDIQELLHKLLNDLHIIIEELAEYINSPSWNCPTFYDDDDEYTIQYREYLENSSNAITPDLPTKEPDNSLSMGDKHLSTIPKTESDEVIKSSVENLVQNPRESEDECECDVPDCDDSQTTKFSTFSNPLFDDSTSSDDESSHEEFIFLNLLLNRDTLMASSPKIDSLLDEFAAELITIPPRIVNREHEEYISLMERLLYNNSSPRLLKDFYTNPNTIIESLPTFPIHVEDSDSLIEEIDLFIDPDDSLPPGIESEDYDSEGDILFLEELLSNDSLSLPETKSFHFDHYDVPSSPRPPTKPPDNKIFFDFEPDTGVLPAKVVEDISEHYVLMPNLLPTQPTFYPDIDTLLPFSSENKDKVFNPSILSSPLLSHLGKFTFDFSESPMMIFGGNIPLLDVSFLHFYPP
ncbi:hypothetical protein Tco_1351706 [Tanacetum coccineum]